jgi:hypothetical protein
MSVLTKVSLTRSLRVHAVVFVPVQPSYLPSERPPLVLEGLEFERVRHAGQALDLVVVHQSDQVVESMVSGKHRRFPGRAFVTLAVAQEDEHAPGRLLKRRGECHSGRYREAVAERAGGNLDAGDSLVGDVAAQQRAIGVVGCEEALVNEPAEGQRGVDGRTGVPLAQNEPVALRALGVGWPDSENPRVEDGESVCAGQRRRDVRAATAVGHADGAPPNGQREFFAGQRGRDRRGGLVRPGHRSPGPWR